jgi:hypothetical protein
MNKGMSVSGTGVDKMNRQQQKAELAGYMAEQSASKQTFHKWMEFLEWAGLALVVGWFALALYVSINHSSVPGTTIAVAWFLFPVSAVPLLLLEGLHTIVLQASAPSLMPGKSRKLITGSRAVRSGWGQIAVALAVGAFWGGLAWAVAFSNLSLIEVYARFLGTALAVAITVSFVAGIAGALYRQFVRPR